MNFKLVFINLLSSVNSKNCLFMNMFRYLIADVMIQFTQRNGLNMIVGLQPSFVKSLSNHSSSERLPS